MNNVIFVILPLLDTISFPVLYRFYFPLYHPRIHMPGLRNATLPSGKKMKKNEKIKINPTSIVLSECVSGHHIISNRSE